jgi:putative oxidoreductase
MKLLNAVTPYAHWLLRAVLASVFVYHGALKFTNLEGFAQMLPISYTQTVLVALAELVGGVLVLLGGFGNDHLADLATRVGAALQVPVLLGAIALVHWGRWNFVPTQDYPMGGMEFQATLILVALYLLVTGNQAFRSAHATS